MTRTVAAVQADMDAAREQSREIGRRLRRLEDEMKEAKLADAAANPHPWLDKKVQRAVRHGWRNNTRTQKGVVRVKQPGEYFRGCGSTVGSLIVVTDSGKTAYEFPARSGEAQWELA